MAEFNFPIYPDLKDKTVLITGGGSGIGASFVEAFVRQGCKVAFIDIQEDASQELARKFASADFRPVFINCDLTDITSLEKSVKQIEQNLGAVRVLVNNAANDQRHEPEDVTPEYWEERIKLNLNHQFFVSQAVQPEMAKAGGGAIINMGSISWHMALEFMPAYTTAKAAIEGLTQSLARAYGKNHIRVNCIIPGQVWTPRQIRDILTPEYEKFMNEKQCIPGRILPEDVAQLALFLGSEAGRMCTRRNYFIDAGIGA